MDKIRDKIISEIQTFLMIYPEVKFRYEYSDKYDSYLVTYIIPSELEENDFFWDTLFDLKSKIIFDLGDSAPLFSEQGSLFSPSSSAILIAPLVAINEDFSTPIGSKYDFPMDDYSNIFLEGFPEYQQAA